MKRLLLISNKNWEAEPILTALTSPQFSPDKKILVPSVLRNPWLNAQGSALPRAIWNNFPDVQIEFWCIQDIMEIPDPSDNELYSSSEIKKDNFYKIIGYSPQPPDLVLALGTAAFGDETQSNNGSVVIGSKIFVHNFHPNGENPKSKWDDPRFERLIDSSIEDSFFGLADAAAIDFIETRFLKPFNHPADKIELLIDKNYLGLSSVNITNYRDYDTADPEGIAQIKQAGITLPVGSIETTHGIIRLASESRFVFISGITDRFKHFNDDVNGKDSKGHTKTIAQNFVCAFNIGFYLAPMLSRIADWLKTV